MQHAGEHAARERARGRRREGAPGPVPARPLAQRRHRLGLGERGVGEPAEGGREPVVEFSHVRGSASSSSSCKVSARRRRAEVSVEDAVPIATPIALATSASVSPAAYRSAIASRSRGGSAPTASQTSIASCPLCAAALVVSSDASRRASVAARRARRCSRFTATRYVQPDGSPIVDTRRHAASARAKASDVTSWARCRSPHATVSVASSRGCSARYQCSNDARSSLVSPTSRVRPPACPIPFGSMLARIAAIDVYKSRGRRFPGCARKKILAMRRW